MNTLVLGVFLCAIALANGVAIDFYNDPNLSGTKLTLGCCNWFDLSVTAPASNNKISSMYTADNWCLQIYEDAYMGGNWRFFRGPFSHNLANFGFNDKITSLYIYPYPDPSTSHITLYDGNYNGASIVLGPGEYPNLGSLGWDNIASSVQTQLLTWVEFYTNTNFGGTKYVIKNQNPQSVVFPAGFNNAISSIRVGQYA